MRYRMMVSALIITLLSACGEEDRSVAGEINRGDLPPDLTHAPHFSLENRPAESLHYEGRYQGLFPCADCEATELTLELVDNQFRRAVRRVGKAESPYVDQGDLKWDEAGTRFQLDNESGSKYLVQDQTLYQLGMDGTQCMQHNGEAFILNYQGKITKPAPDNSQEQIDFAGLYQGVYPCADCEGIEITLDLTYDNGYTRTIDYLGTDEVSTDSGMFEWDEAENRITLVDADPQSRFLVKEGMLEQLDLEGNPIESQFDYQLIKQEGVAEKVAEEALNDGHNAQNALSYAGRYQGLFPCADCEGIEVELTIDYDQNYERKVTYLGESPTEIVERGTFHWDQSGSKITLDGLSDGEIAHYFVGENILYQLDQNLEQIESATGSDYSLKMIESRE